MFEKAVLLGAPRRDGLTLGKVAEALLFYRAVHLVLDTGSVLELVRVLGVDGLIELLKREGVTATFVEGLPVTMSDSIGPLKAHRFDFMSFVPEGVPQGLLKGRRQIRMAPLAQRLLREGVSKAQTSKLVGALVDLVPNKNLSTGDFGVGLSAVALDDLK